ncbi:entericidin A/B family lipoprotein [Citromicrobium bathyomarinum]
MIRKIALAVSVAALGLTATACNTVKGLGQDVESVGQAGEDAID